MTNAIELAHIGGTFIVNITTGAICLQNACFNAAHASGWWTDLRTGEALNNQAGEEAKVNIPEKLMLIVSEVAEAMEGHRKNLQDDKLPHRKMLEVELADAVIRIFDLAGGLSLDLSGAIVEKLQYNANREDHKIANRQSENGKKF